MDTKLLINQKSAWRVTVFRVIFTSWSLWTFLEFILYCPVSFLLHVFVSYHLSTNMMLYDLIVPNWYSVKQMVLIEQWHWVYTAIYPYLVWSSFSGYNWRNNTQHQLLKYDKWKSFIATYFRKMLLFTEFFSENISIVNKNNPSMEKILEPYSFKETVSNVLVLHNCKKIADMSLWM